MVNYRLATPADAGCIVLLLAEIMQHHGVTPPGRERLQGVVDAVLASSDHFFLVAVSEGAIVGMCALIFSYSTWSASTVCELQDVVVTTESRRRSVGRGLLEAAEDMAREKGCSRLFLSAESWNLEAQRFYRRLGLAEKTYLYFERDLLGGSA
jgi:GNAT superfamily N-acetyltransferase